MRADLVGVTADVARLGAQYVWHESAEFEIQVQATRFSDGNDGRRVSLLGARKVVDQPRLDLTVRPRIDAVTHSRTDTFYFSPRRAWTAALTLEAQYITSRRYERFFIQRAEVTLGAYDQHAIGTEPIGTVLYEHNWRRDPDTELGYGIAWSSNVYDGQRESSWRGYLNVLRRFGR